MYLTPHAITGGIIGEKIGSPILAFALGFLSHFILDAIPHGDEAIGNPKNTKGRKYYIKLLMKIEATDLLGLILFVIFLKYSDISNPLAVFAGSAGAILPDILWGVNIFLDNKFLKFKERLHCLAHNPFGIMMSARAGIAWQSFFVILGVVLFIFA